MFIKTFSGSLKTKINMAALLICWLISSASSVYSSHFSLKTQYTDFSQWQDLSSLFLIFGIIPVCSLWWTNPIQRFWRVLGLLPIIAIYVFVSLMIIALFHAIFA